MLDLMLGRMEDCGFRRLGRLPRAYKKWVSIPQRPMGVFRAQFAKEHVSNVTRDDGDDAEMKKS